MAPQLVLFQLPRLPGSALKVPVVGWGGGWVGSYPLSSLTPTHVEVELGCENRFSQPSLTGQSLSVWESVSFLGSVQIGGVRFCEAGDVLC